MSTILASSFKKQTQFLIPALLLASVPFWSFSDKTFAESSTLIFWYSFVMMLPVSVAFLLVIRRRLNNGQNIFFIASGGRLYSEDKIEVSGVATVIKADKIILIIDKNIYSLSVPE